MASFGFDQAEGLRRMTAGPKPHVLTLLSAVPAEDKHMMLVNFAAALERIGQDVLVLDARCDANGIMAGLGITPIASLADVAQGERTVEQVVRSVSHGFSIAALSSGQLAKTTPRLGLENAFSRLMEHCTVLIVDAELGKEGDLPIGAIAAGETVVQVANTAESIKNAYALVKRLNATLGRRPSDVVVTGAPEKEARLVYTNLARTASRYLAVELQSAGFIPGDPHLARAMSLGRAVVDAYPLAEASAAFRQLAKRFAQRNSYPKQIGVSDARPDHLITAGA